MLLQYLVPATENQDLRLVYHTPSPSHPLTLSPPLQLKQVERESVGVSPLTPSSLYEEFLRSLKSELTSAHQQKTDKEEERRTETLELPSRKPGLLK